MKRTIKTILLLVFLVGIVVFLVGRIRWPIPLDHGWSSPVVVTGTQNADAGGGDLYKWHDTLILMNEQQEWLPHSSICSFSTCSIMIRNNDSSNSWTQLTPIRVPGYYAFYCPTFDQASDRIIFEGGNIESNELHTSAIFVRMTANNRIQVEAERKWTTDKKSLFGETGPNVLLEHGLSFGIGIINSSDIYLPYSVRGETRRGNTIYDDEGPFNNGVFHSTDFGATWQMEKISDTGISEPKMCKTTDDYYLVAIGEWEVWSARKSIDGDGSWEKPKILTKTFAGQRGGGAVAENDTVHVCWLDRRHEKWTLNFAFPYLGNYEVFYRQRKDADSAWRKDVILSQGMLFSYWPSMSVEGNRIVVAWVGAIDKNGSHDVFYATSKDGGKTWARPLKVTESAKGEITSERTQVVLQNGVIHLFYAQGKWDRHEQVRSQGSWPVYYQQRPFPN